jgi:hypothetical protein
MPIHVDAHAGYRSSPVRVKARVPSRARTRAVERLPPPACWPASTCSAGAKLRDLPNSPAWGDTLAACATRPTTLEKNREPGAEASRPAPKAEPTGPATGLRCSRRATTGGVSRAMVSRAGQKVLAARRAAGTDRVPGPPSARVRSAAIRPLRVSPRRSTRLVSSPPGTAAALVPAGQCRPSRGRRATRAQRSGRRGTTPPTVTPTPGTRCSRSAIRQPTSPTRRPGKPWPKAVRPGPGQCRPGPAAAPGPASFSRHEVGQQTSSPGASRWIPDGSRPATARLPSRQPPGRQPPSRQPPSRQPPSRQPPGRQPPGRLRRVPTARSAAAAALARQRPANPRDGHAPHRELAALQTHRRDVRRRRRRSQPRRARERPVATVPARDRTPLRANATARPASRLPSRARSC